jgi:hypothetical protein
MKAEGTRGQLHTGRQQQDYYTWASSNRTTSPGKAAARLTATGLLHLGQQQQDNFTIYITTSSGQDNRVGNSWREASKQQKRTQWQRSAACTNTLETKAARD